MPPSTWVRDVWDAEEFEDDPGATVFRDVLMLTLVGFIAMVVLMLPHLSKSEDQTEEQEAPGSVVIEIHWPGQMAADVDLWVQAPNDIPVGFFNQNGVHFNLLRDDLGVEGDASGKNYEISYSRGIVAGEYIVNVHQYGPLDGGVKVPVNVIVSVRQQYDSLRQILDTNLELYRRNQEETAFRFRLTDTGELVEGSVTTLRKRLITRGGSKPRN